MSTAPPGPSLAGPHTQLEQPRGGRRVRTASAARGAVVWGPAFVAAIAYVDPGNVATDFAAGAEQSYRLLWVVLLANAAAMLMQYLAAKLTAATGSTLPELLRARTRRLGGLALLVQAEAVALATDLAEVVGGAVALQLLFGLPLVAGALVTAGVSWLILSVQKRWSATAFQAVVAGLGGVVALGFLATTVAGHPEIHPLISGLMPHATNRDGITLAVGIVGATVMPHAIYMHGSLFRDRSLERQGDGPAAHRAQAVRGDVFSAMSLAGIVNCAMLVTAAATLTPAVGDDLSAIHAGLAVRLGPVLAAAFALALLASGLAATSAGTYAGGAMLEGFIQHRIPGSALRMATLVPSVAVLTLGVQPGQALVFSQIALSFGLPAALWPLIALTASRHVMGEHRNAPATTIAAIATAAVITALDAALIVTTLA